MTQQMSSPILVLADQVGDHLTPLARQAVTLAASLTSADVVALSLAATPDVAALSELGATQLLHADLGDAARSSVVASDALVSALASGSFGLVLLCSDYRGREIAGRVGALTEAGVVSGASSVGFDGGVLQIGKTALGGSWSMRIVLEGQTPIVGIASGVIDEAPVASPVTLTPQALAVELSPEASAIQVVSSVPDDEEGVSLTDASTVVCGGRGVDGDFELVRSVAQVLGGAVGATRVACDEGWAPRSEQIGQTGLTVTPNLYIGLGVSGAIHHTVGMQSSAHIVAVCDDPDAPIFEIADFGVVGDVTEVVPAALAAIEEARSQALASISTTRPPRRCASAPFRRGSAPSVTWPHTPAIPPPATSEGGGPVACSTTRASRSQRPSAQTSTRSFSRRVPPNQTPSASWLPPEVCVAATARAT